MKKNKLRNSQFYLKTVWFIVFFLFINSSSAQLVVRTNRTVADLVQNVLASKGVKVSNITSSANINAIGFFDGRLSNLGLDSGILLSTGNIINAIGPNISGNTGTSNNQPGDSSIKKINPNEDNFDAAWIKFTVIPESNNLNFRFVFASEEYPEFINQSYNDAFGLFIEGQNYPSSTNLAIIQNTNIPVSIKTVNHLTNSTYYRDNTNGNSVSFDGFTTILEAKANVVSCTPYELKIVIADIKDLIYDSGIFIEAQSLQSINDAAVTVQFKKDFFTECDSQTVSFFRNSSDLSQPLTVNFELSGTANIIQDYTASNTNQVVIPAGQFSTSIKIKPIVDGIAEPSESIILKITNPIICDTISILSTILDYKKIDSIEFTYDCFDSFAVVTIRGSDKLDSIKWYDHQKNFINTGNMLTIKRIDNNIYFFIEAIEKCTGDKIIDSILIQFYDIDIISDTIICYGDTLQLSAVTNFPGAKFEWSSTTNGAFIPSPLSANPKLIPERSGIIKVVLTNDGYCGVKTIKLEVIKLSVESDSVNVCGSGTPIQLKASGGTKYKWSPNLYLDNDSIPNPICTALNDISYTLEISKGNCSRNITVDVTVDTMFNLIANDNLYICSREFANLNVVGSPTGTYLWSPTTGIDDPSSPNPKANPISTTTYYVVGYNGSCSSVDSVIVYVVNPVESNMNYSFDSCFKTFIANQVDASDSTDVIWDMGNGDTIIGPSVYYQYTTPGSYRIKSILNRQAPCIDSETVQIYMPNVDITKRRIPDAFTPNGDGINDEFKIYFGNLPCAVESFEIFNRWGQLVYNHKSRGDLSWDGKLNGELCSAGIYVYIIKGEGFEDSGWLALIR